MTRAVIDPAGELAYLAEANYFRLGYQLAAQLMHQEESGEKKGALFEMASDILYGERRYPETKRGEARRRAEELAQEAEVVLGLYRRRRETKRLWLIPGKLSFKEERLEEFLRRTVQPCLVVVIAASLRSADSTEAEATIAPLRERAELDRSAGDEGGISYRAIYNLACFEAGGGDRKSHEAALRYLATALDRAPGSRRRELGKWARKDPSFRPLQEMPAFEELLEPYA